MASILKVDELAGNSNTEIIVPQNTRLVVKDQIVRTYYKESQSAYTYAAGTVDGSLGFVDTDLELTVKQTIPGTKFLVHYRASVDVSLDGITSYNGHTSQTRIIRFAKNNIGTGGADPDRVTNDASNADQFTQFIPGFVIDKGTASSAEGINTVKYESWTTSSVAATYLFHEPHLFTGMDETDLDFNTKYTYRIQFNGNNAGTAGTPISFNFLQTNNWNRSSHLIIHEIGT
jgi:hypothetical protein